MLNPITYTERVVGDFLRYQLSTYAFADAKLNAQLRKLLSLEQTRNTPLLKGPYISLSRAFRDGAEVRQLVAEGIFHPHMKSLVPYEHVFGHQESAIREIAAGRTTLVSTGTGSGKSECFLYPIISHCLKLRDAKAPEGIAAVIVYPMNALAEDQLHRLRGLLAGTGVTFGMYVGKTKEHEREVAGYRLPLKSSRADYEAKIREIEENKLVMAVHPPEERVSREEMRKPGNAPRILLTNTSQLELLLTRHKDVELFDQADLRYLVFDEAHTFSGAHGAETACLIRRLRAYCGRNAEQTVCIATSATIADPERGPDAGRHFASRFFGVPGDSVALVGEEYAEDLWSKKREATRAFPGDPAVILQTIIEAVRDIEEDPPANAAVQKLRTCFQVLTGSTLEARRWPESLYERLAANEVVYRIAQGLRQPRPLSELVGELEKSLKRPVPEEEVLTWLALGAASREEGRPLLRPVVHGFVRGMGGAVVTFAADGLPRLWLSGEDTVHDDEAKGLIQLPVHSCTTCGQHYFTHALQDFHFTGSAPEGGDAVDDGTVWSAKTEALGGRRIVLLDRVVGADEHANGGASSTSAIPPQCQPLLICRACGACHPDDRSRCLGCGKEDTLLRLLVVRQKADNEGFLTSCVACGANGRRFAGRYREPARPLRAVAVSDVHVLAQALIQHAQRRRLLVFADNRQDAAFQAGWMRDHARRYRFRSLMAQRIQESPVTIGDLVARLDDLLEADDDLSRTLIPEVWRVARRESAPKQHAEERRQYLRIQVLREVTVGSRQRIGLEPWGRLRVEYLGLQVTHAFVTDWAARLALRPDELQDGIAALLDYYRRSYHLLDREGRIYSRFWHESDREVQRGYLPVLDGVPKGLKLRRDATDSDARVTQIHSTRGLTSAAHAARRFGVKEADVGHFLEELWTFLSGETRILAPEVLKGSRGGPLPGCSGVYQIDGDRIVLHPHRGAFVCDTCRKSQSRATPKMACPGYRCDGTLAFLEEDPDDYDLLMLDQGFAMLRPEEHSAQIPNDKRETLERTFKGPGERINTLVCTPTLELGVDIGALDAVLMRNVPPLPANYWQRAGRAGRRHRMAVNLTYARAHSHDNSYFHDPLKMLGGLIRPPSFNLRNDVMVRKHVHASALTVLHSLARANSSVAEHERVRIRQVLDRCFPTFIRSYLFDETGQMLAEPLNVEEVGHVVEAHREAIRQHLARVFSEGWPHADKDSVATVRLDRYLAEMARELQSVIHRLSRRLRWADDQIRRLEEVRGRKGTLDPEEDALRRRCDQLIKKLKGQQARRGRDAEGYDDTITFSVLGAEGFLPGYGLGTGNVVGTHLAPKAGGDIEDWELRRALALALREYVPGNLIYANGHRFTPRFFHLEVEKPLLFFVDLQNEAVSEIGTADATGPRGIGALEMKAVPICDVDLPHFSHISDEEVDRFRLSVAVVGYEQRRHDGGKAWLWGERLIKHRKAVQLRLVNLGPDQLVRDQQQLGYPVCLVCGQSRSPFSSQAELDNFRNDHRQRCGKPVESSGFYCDVHADALSLPSCEDRDEAFSLAEALRRGAAEVLEMGSDDLQLLALAHPGDKDVDILLYDPMPGGSGLLDQMIERWGEVTAAALRIVSGCASNCERACIDCLFTFRNAFYHRHLDRHRAKARLERFGASLTLSHELPPELPNAPGGGQPVNITEDGLRRMLEKAGFTGFECQKRIKLGKPFDGTTPDFFFADPSGRMDGICIYLDGLSRGLHGKPETRQRDKEIREELRNHGYEVIEIAATALDDREHMRRVFYRLGRLLLSREDAEAIRERSDWLGEGSGSSGSSGSSGKPRDSGGAAPKDGVAVFDLSNFGVDGAKPLGAINLHGIDPETYWVVRNQGAGLAELAAPGSLLLVKKTGIEAPWPENGAIVIVRHPDLRDPDLGPGLGIGALKVASRTDVDGKVVSMNLTLRPKTPDTSRRAQQIHVPIAEWRRIRPVGEVVRVLTLNEVKKWRG